MNILIILILFLPLLGVILNLLLNKILDKKIIYINVISVCLSAFCWIILYFQFNIEHKITVSIFHWINLPDFSIYLNLYLDKLSFIMAGVVTVVSSLIHIYSIGYMAHDKGIKRYFLYLNLFVFSMLLLILGDNLLTLFVGWEGVGLCSYLLIGFWFTKKTAADAGQKAFIVNRIGDYGFILGLLILFSLFSTLNIHNINLGLKADINHSLNFVMLNLAALFLFIGATGKSAQIPLYVWLPDAMEGPTPVSALIHAATMVTAGVYMIVRLSPLFDIAIKVSGLIVYIGSLTAFFAATIAIVNNDIKRILAYSTISQLGYMFAAAGAGVYSAAVFHLYTHAFFKSLLFLGAGSIMHAMNNSTDIRQMGNLIKKLPITGISFIIGSLSLAGFPLFSGFFSKEEILSAAASYPIPFILLTITAAMTAFYMTRCCVLVLFDRVKNNDLYNNAHESPKPMTFALIILAIFSIIGAYTLSGSGFFFKFNSDLFFKRSLEEHHFISHNILLIMSIFCSFGGIILGILIYQFKIINAEKLKIRLNILHQLIYNKYKIDEVYEFLFVNRVKDISNIFYRTMDNKFIDGCAHFIAGTADVLSVGLRLINNGSVRFYSFIFITGVFIIILFL